MIDICTILIGGKAGEGVKKAAQVVASALLARGMRVCQNDDYQSLIRGGHNFSVVTASLHEVFTTYDNAGLIICFDKRSVSEHAHKLAPDGLLFYNSDEATDADGIGIPMTSLMKKHYPAGANVSISAVAVFCAVYGIPAPQMDDLIKAQYKSNAFENISYANAVYELISARDEALPDPVPNPRRLLSGNQAIALGAWKAGMDFYYGYPMTPASSLLHYLALKQDSMNVYAIHAESELAAINMAIGSALAGCRVGVGSSGGGFALMQEAFSAAGMAEAPLLCVLSSRPGPATGVSTYTAQEDLFFALHQGHGEFPRVVACPDSHAWALSLAAELLSIAWETQSPVILLTEKHLSEGVVDALLDADGLPSAEAVSGTPGADYNRYAITENGISPLFHPGSAVAPDSVVKWTTHEHLESGLRTDAAQDIVAMKDKRNRKARAVRQAVERFETVAEYGAGDNIVFAYGSTVLELREAAKHCSFPLRIVAPIYLEPFPHLLCDKYRDRCVVVAEHSSTGQFGKFVKEKTGARIMKNILKYDGRPWDPVHLANELREAFHA